MNDTRSIPPRSNWNISQRTSKSTALYALALVDIDASNQSQLNNFSARLGNSPLSDLAFAQFAFNVNPKSMTLEEPAAATVTPTQNGGQFIEHQGQIYKNIRINGTTGLRPNRNTEGAIIPIANVVNPLFGLETDPQTGLPVGERTGFDDLIDLRNLFRLYWDMKQDPEYASTTIMVWQNGKEGEFYVVEPMNFNSSRDSSSPLTFTYDITLRTIERLDVRKLKSFSDSYLERNGVDTFFQRMADVRTQIIAAFNIATSYTDRAVSIGQAAINNVLSPVNDVIQALTGIVNSGKRVFNIPRNSLALVANNALDLATAFDNLSLAYTEDGVADQLADVSHAYKTINRSLHTISAETQLFSTPLSTTMATKQKAYADPLIGAPKTGGSPLYIGNQRSTNSAAITTVNGGENIFGLAQRLLGDRAKWKILVVLNQLKPPYISPAGDGVNVLRPGDQVLYPRQLLNSRTAIQPTEQKYTGVSPLSERLGRDIQLRAIEAASGVVLYDIVVGPNGDIATIEGLDNMEQALRVKFDTEQGELPTHPGFGIKYPTGSKAQINQLIGFQVNARATLLSDSRIASVDQLTVAATGNILNVNSTVTLKGADDSLSLDFSVKR